MRLPSADDDLTAWRECHDCGLFQRLPEIPDGEAAMCSRCGALLRRAARDTLAFARASAVVSALLLLLAMNLPFVELRVLGHFVTSTLFTGPEKLGKDGAPALAVVVLMTVIVMPSVKVLVEIAVLFGAYARPAPRWLPWLFGCLERIAPWAMIEVFLLGAFVAYTRLRAMATVDIGPAVYAIGGVMFFVVATDATLDREAIWEELDANVARPPPPRLSLVGDSDAKILGCHVCRRVLLAKVGDRCTRCRHRLFHRREGTLRNVWALLITAGLLYIPANVLPVMTVERLGKGGPTTILNGVVELGEAHLWPLALLVLLASIIVPMVKLVSLVGMLVMTHRRSSAWLVKRARLFRFVHAIGRWSMIDIFMLATLVGVVRLGFLSTVLPGLGAAAFCAVVLVTMVATELFDPRVMWDAAAAGRRDESEAVS